MSLPRFTWSSDALPDQTMIDVFERDGALIIENFVDADGRRRLVERIDDLVDGFDPETVRTVFSTSEQSHAADTYFRESGDRIRFFLEEGALANGELTQPKSRVLNKIGHALHDLDPVFDGFSRMPALDRLARGLGQTDPGLVQSMVIFKQPRIGGEVSLHQDATFLHTEPVSVIGFWFALEDADETNGCLYALPGGHKAGLQERFHYNASGNLVMEPVAAVDWDLDAAIPLVAPAGTLVVLHGLLPHRSGPNTSPRSRLAYTLHVVDRAAAWSPDNWLRRADTMPVRGF
ncbi:MAG: phytanoyl-CoA dioxygenase family protein [Pseudomonadota bacterium]